VLQYLVLRSDDFELELGLIQTQMTQKPMLRAEVYARAASVSFGFVLVRVRVQRRDDTPFCGWESFS